MRSFATELATRFVAHDDFWVGFLKLQRAGAKSTIQRDLESDEEEPSPRELARLLYCASVLAQAKEEDHKAMAQSIALNALLVCTERETQDRCVRVLSDLGNFPGIAYARQHFGALDLSLLGLLRRRLAEKLNTVSVGDKAVSLTDYQKSVWDSLPEAKCLAISAPTSAGKSFLVVEHMCRFASKHEQFTAVYVAPTRALLSEIHQTVMSRMMGVEGVRISTVPSLDAASNPRQLFILTQERLQVLLSISELRFDLVVVDEAQNLSDGPRGMILQDCLEQAIRRNSNTRVIMLAPGAEGLAEAASVIGLPSIQPSMTRVSPVLQNRILVSRVAGANQLRLGLMSRRGVLPIGNLHTDRGFDLPASRLASVALELGTDGGSLVYATGPAVAEKVALQLSQARDVSSDPRLEALACFIEQHIHKDYRLAEFVRKGVAFHYGKMPALLRESLEAAFKSGAIPYLSCTTTLFQGVNLPARNVFIGTPTRGRGEGTVLDPAMLWNFAGRAGRMVKDIVGNVFLVDYEDWPERSMDEFAQFQVKPAIGATLTERYDQVLAALGGNMPELSPRDDTPARIRASAGLLIAKASSGDVQTFATRVLPEMSEPKVSALAAAADDAARTLGLPAAVLVPNWVIDPFGLKRLYDRLVEKIRGDDMVNVVPVNPHEKNAVGHYAAIFSRISKAVYRRNGRFGWYASSLAVPWMKGVPYPVIVSDAIRYAQRAAEKKAKDRTKLQEADPQLRVRRPRKVDTSVVIRKVFDGIEDVVRFQFVQLGKAYIDLLALALRSEGKGKLVTAIFDFSLALELGIATESGRSFIELGLSRIAASALEPLYPDSSLSVSEARSWLWGMDLESSNLSSVIVDELRRLGLSRPVDASV